MASIGHGSSRTNFNSLPLELRQHIITYVYLPWHLEYTQVHDKLPERDTSDLLSAVRELAVDYKSTPRFSNLPSIAPLLASKAFFEAGKDIFHSSFTGHVHVVSRMVWREVHWTYESILAKGTDLTIDDDYFWTFRDMRILQKMKSLQSITIILSASVTRGKLRLGSDTDTSSSQELAGPLFTEFPDGIPLENSELKSYLPSSLELPDEKLESLWPGLVAGRPTDFRIQMQTDSRMRMEMLSRDVESGMNAMVVWRCILRLPLAKNVTDDVQMFLVMDFHYDFPRTGDVRFTGELQPRLVRKRLVKRHWLEISSF